MRWLILLALLGCGADEDTDTDTDTVAIEVDRTDLSVFARVAEVSVSGSNGDYRLTVSLDTADLDCSQYADWWEVIDPEVDAVLFRQPLDGPWRQSGLRESVGEGVAIMLDRQVVVRVHVHPYGYGGLGALGSVRDGIEPSDDATLVDRFQGAAQRGTVPTPCE